jgi:hypothetical protein
VLVGWVWSGVGGGAPRAAEIVLDTARTHTR